MEGSAVTPLLLAETERNLRYKRCAHDGCHSPASHFCSKCKLTPYCSRNCQSQHWVSHKPYCLPYSVRSEDEDGVGMVLALVGYLKEEGAFPEDWEVPYPFVYIEPGPSATTIESTISRVQGFADAKLPLLGSAYEGTSSPEGLNERFQWSYTGTKDIVRGFSYEDAFALRAWASDMFDSYLPPNDMGSHLIYVKGCRGGVLVQKFDVETGEVLQITRREVWELTSVRGVGSTLTDRMIRENMRRYEQEVAMAALFGTQLHR